MTVVTVVTVVMEATVVIVVTTVTVVKVATKEYWQISFFLQKYNKNQSLIVTKPKNSNCNKSKNSNCDKTQKLNLWKNLTTQIVTKL